MLRPVVEKYPLNRGLALEWKKATADLEVPHEIQGDCMFLFGPFDSWQYAWKVRVVGPCAVDGQRGRFHYFKLMTAATLLRPGEFASAFLEITFSPLRSGRRERCKTLDEPNHHQHCG